MFNTYFVDVIKNHYVDFKGRATRKQFWLFTLFNFIFAVILSMLGSMENTVGDVFDILNLIYSLAVLLPSLAIAIRRLHDIGRSGWWFLIGFVPFIGQIILLIFYVLPSKNN